MFESALVFDFLLQFVTHQIGKRIPVKFQFLFWVCTDEIQIACLYLNTKFPSLLYCLGKQKTVGKIHLLGKHYLYRCFTLLIYLVSEESKFHDWILFVFLKELCSILHCSVPVLVSDHAPVRDVCEEVAGDQLISCYPEIRK